jgi:hypothetical protein
MHFPHAAMSSRERRNYDWMGFTDESARFTPVDDELWSKYLAYDCAWASAHFTHVMTTILGQRNVTPKRWLESKRRDLFSGDDACILGLLVVSQPGVRYYGGGSDEELYPLLKRHFGEQDTDWLAEPLSDEARVRLACLDVEQFDRLAHTDHAWALHQLPLLLLQPRRLSSPPSAYLACLAAWPEFSALGCHLAAHVLYDQARHSSEAKRLSCNVAPGLLFELAQIPGVEVCLWTQLSLTQDTSATPPPTTFDPELLIRDLIRDATRLRSSVFWVHPRVREFFCIDATAEHSEGVQLVRSAIMRNCLAEVQYFLPLLHGLRRLECVSPWDHPGTICHDCQMTPIQGRLYHAVPLGEDGQQQRIDLCATCHAKRTWTPKDHVWHEDRRLRIGLLHFPTCMGNAALLDLVRPLCSTAALYASSILSGLAPVKAELEPEWDPTTRAITIYHSTKLQLVWMHGDTAFFLYAKPPPGANSMDCGCCGIRGPKPRPAFVLPLHITHTQLVKIDRVESCDIVLREAHGLQQAVRHLLPRRLSLIASTDTPSRVHLVHWENQTCTQVTAVRGDDEENKHNRLLLQTHYLDPNERHAWCHTCAFEQTPRPDQAVMQPRLDEIALAASGFVLVSGDDDTHTPLVLRHPFCRRHIYCMDRSTGHMRRGIPLDVPLHATIENTTLADIDKAWFDVRIDWDAYHVLHLLPVTRAALARARFAYDASTAALSLLCFL